jgi:hypothetical protein
VNSLTSWFLDFLFGGGWRDGVLLDFGWIVLRSHDDTHWIVEVIGFKFLARVRMTQC